MPYRLKDRNRALPNGVAVYDQHTGFRAAPFASFTVQWQGLQQARIGNPGAVKRYNLKTDDASCQDFVDLYLGRVAFDNGWSDFYVTSAIGGGIPEQVPFPQAPRRKQGAVERIASRAAGVVAGSKTIYEWINSKGEAVPQELANKRAETCVKCPLNEPPDGMLDDFEVKAAAAIRGELERKKGWNLTTPADEKLGICGACWCVNSLSVHCPLETKLKHIPKDAYAALDVNCWVRTEQVK